MDGSTLSVSKLIDLLPLIIISVIVLVGFFTWEVFTQHLAPFILLITSVLFAIWLYSGDIESYLRWKTAGEDQGGDPIIPPPPDGDGLALPTNIIMLIVGGVVALLATGLTLGITSYKIGNNIGSTSTQINVMNTFGYGFMGVGGIIIISLLWKAFRSSTDDSAPGGAGDEEGGRSNIFKIIGALVSSAFGIYMVTRATNLKTAQSQEVTDTGAVPTSIANTVLNIGLVMQVIAMLIALYMMYQYKVFHLAVDAGNGAKAFKFTLPIICAIAGVIFILSHYNVIPSAEGVDKGTDRNNMYAAHAIVYFVIAGITLVMAFGETNTITIFKGIGILTVVGLIGVFFWNFIALNINDNFNLDPVNDATNGNAYYQQVRDEVIKELKASGKPEDVTDTVIDRKIQERVDELNTSNQTAVLTANNMLLIIVLILTIIIAPIYAAKMKIVECMKLPVSFKNVFIGTCNDPADYVPNTTLTKQFENGGPANIEKMTGDDWDKVMEAAAGSNFSKVGVTLASASRWIPFFTIILVILCVSILFTNVTTSEATMEWIAKSFRGDMFPKVKSLLDTFFIVFIVGLILCSILVLPMVRKQNVGGLDVITKFINSIQVWQYSEDTAANIIVKFIVALVGFLVVFFYGLSWYWTYLRIRGNDDPALPDRFVLPLVLVILFAICCIPAFYHLLGSEVHEDFKKDGKIIRGLRLFFTSVYLVPLLLISVFKLVIYVIPYLIELAIAKIKSSYQPRLKDRLEKELEKLNFIKWHAAAVLPDRGTDLRMFGLGDILLPKDVVSGVAAAAAAPATVPPPGSPAAPPAVTTETPEKSKVNAVGQLIKVIFIVIIFVILILFIVYTVYKISAEKQPDGESATADGGFVAQLNTPTAHAIYVIMAIVAIAGFVAYLREKFKSANTKTPEDYVFNDLKPEDSNSPMRQLTFGMTHIIYIILMIVVWAYDTDKDDSGRMSVIGMTFLGVAIIFFHYVLELIDNKLPPSAAADAVPKLAPMSNLLSNIRFIVNTVFLIILSILAYYKQHGVMVALIVIMFLFHLSKSILGVKLLKLLWAGIIYIPCLFLDLLKSSQSVVGDTTRTIWVIVAIEVLLIAILYGGPYLVNYIGASASQIVARPVSLKQLYDTNLTTQSKEIFIYHNTGIDRTDADKAANCAPEEKKRYHYAISGWFFLNNNINTKTSDLEIFNFGDVPKMTYNPSKNELKIICDLLSMSDGGASTATELYNSRKNYNAVIRAGHSTDEDVNKQIKSTVEMSLEDDELDADILLQRWNYFVINYDGKTMDFFLNNKLVFKSEFIMPDIQLKPITVGSTTDNKGLNGSICNFAFHKYPLTKEQIRWTYNMLKSQNPPMIGMSTVEDEVSVTDTTKVYSR